MMHLDGQTFGHLTVLDTMAKKGVECNGGAYSPAAFYLVFRGRPCGICAGLGAPFGIRHTSIVPLISLFEPGTRFAI